MTHPNPHKTAILTWVVVYPIITILLICLEPFLRDVALPIRTLILTAIMVPIMVYLAMPAATSFLRRWLGSGDG